VSPKTASVSMTLPRLGRQRYPRPVRKCLTVIAALLLATLLLGLARTSFENQIDGSSKVAAQTDVAQSIAHDQNGATRRWVPTGAVVIGEAWPERDSDEERGRAELELTTLARLTRPRLHIPRMDSGDPPRA
jgi:hypothetical protein